jgi:hypothetical protein
LKRFKYLAKNEDAPWLSALPVHVLSNNGGYPSIFLSRENVVSIVQNLGCFPIWGWPFFSRQTQMVGQPGVDLAIERRNINEYHVFCQASSYLHEDFDLSNHGCMFQQGIIYWDIPRNTTNDPEILTQGALDSLIIFGMNDL